MALWDLVFFHPSKGMNLNFTLGSLDPDSGRGNVDCHCHSLLTSLAQGLNDVTKNSALVPFALQTSKIMVVLLSPNPRMDMCRWILGEPQSPS